MRASGVGARDTARERMDTRDLPSRYFIAKTQPAGGWGGGCDN